MLTKFYGAPLLLLCCWLTTPSLSAQIQDPDGHLITCAMRDTAFGAFQPAAGLIQSGSARLQSRFVIDFSDNVPAGARNAISFAADVWGAYLISAVPIRVSVDWEDRDDERLLASAGPSTLFRDFPGGEPDAWYPVALAESIAGTDLNDEEDPDIRINANSTANWYFGTDGNTPRRQIDLASVTLHELGHGLGFLSSVDTISETELGIGFGGRLIIYDVFLETGSGVPLSDESMFANPSAGLLRAVSRDDLFFNGPQANQAFSGEVPLFAPATFDGGSSVSHLSERLFRPGTENALMTPFLAAGEAVHDPGPITLGVFEDMGYDVVQALTSVVSPAEVTVRVFPNPSTDLVTVQLGNGAPTRELSLFSVNGRRVRSRTVAPGETAPTLDVGDLIPGVYVLVGRGGQSWRQRLLVR